MKLNVVLVIISLCISGILSTPTGGELGKYFYNFFVVLVYSMAKQSCIIEKNKKICKAYETDENHSHSRHAKF